jgi:hypothetical protein
MEGLECYLRLHFCKPQVIPLLLAHGLHPSGPVLCSRISAVVDMFYIWNLGLQRTQNTASATEKRTF